MIDEENFDIALKEAFIEYQKREVAALWDEFSKAEPHVFSERFENKMKKLVKFTEKPYFRFVNTFAKRAAVFIVVIMISLSAAFSVKAIREPVIKFFIEVYEKFTHVVFQTDADEALSGNVEENPNGNNVSEGFPDTIEDIYEPTIIPDGYTLADNMFIENYLKNTYQNQNGQDLIFEQFVITSVTLNVDTEDAETVEETEIGNMHALWAQNKNTNILVWNDNKYGYQITGLIEKERMIEMALSLKKSQKID